MVKLRSDVLEKIISKLHIGDTRCLLGPKIGEDASIIDISGLKYLIIHTDPITGASSISGWLSIVIPANDVSVQGGIPRWISTCILLPENYPEDKILSLVNQMYDACKMLNIDIVGGHTEYCPVIDRPLIISTCIGISNRPIKTSNARPGDLIVMIRSAGIEAALVLISDMYDKLKDRVRDDIINRIRTFYRELSIVDIARNISEYVNSMHDPTEGGVLQGLYEVARASNTCIEVWLSEIPVRPEIHEVCKVVGIDPLKSLGSGCLIVSTSAENLENIVNKVKTQVPESEIRVIGRVLKYIDNPHVKVLDRKDGSLLYTINNDIPDGVMLLWSK